jgi:hypothetical protein
MVKLFMFASFPFGPGIERAEFTAGESAKCLFCWCDGLRGDGRDEELDNISGDRGFREVEARKAERGDGADISNCQSWNMVGPVWIIGSEEVMFEKIFLQELGIHVAFRGKLEVNASGSIVVSFAEKTDGVIFGENRRAIDRNKVSQSDFIPSGLRGGV